MKHQIPETSLINQNGSCSGHSTISIIALFSRQIILNEQQHHEFLRQQPADVVPHLNSIDCNISLQHF